MKMGTTASPWCYDAEASAAIQPVNLRFRATASLAEIFLISKHGPAPARLVDIGVATGLMRFSLRRLGYNRGAPRSRSSKPVPTTATSSVVKKK